MFWGQLWATLWSTIVQVGVFYCKPQLLRRLSHV